MLKRFFKASGDQELLNAERVMILAITVLIISLVATQIAHLRSVNRDSTRKADLYSIQLSLQKYFALNSYYPRSLAGLSGLSQKDCSDPTAGGSCSDPAYAYKAFASGVKPTLSANSTCDNHQVACAGYVLYSSHMETTANPYALTSY